MEHLISGTTHGVSTLANSLLKGPIQWILNFALVVAIVGSIICVLYLCFRCWLAGKRKRKRKRRLVKPPSKPPLSKPFQIRDGPIITE